jgi:hypothetical protein
MVTGKQRNSGGSVIDNHLVRTAYCGATEEA